MSEMDPTRQRAEDYADEFVIWCFVCDERVRKIGAPEHRDHEQHVIPEKALAEARAEGRREGLREAADAMDQSESPRWTRGEVRDWLMSRASESAPTPEEQGQ